MTITKQMKEEIERMMDVYEIYELSEESGLQNEFEKDVIKIFQAGENSKHKSDLQQELEFLENEVWHLENQPKEIKITIKNIKNKINFIKKELEEIGK